MKRLLYILLTTIMPLLGAQAQYAFQCDFETDSLRQLWTLNPGANATLISRAENKWIIGGDDANHTDGGHHGITVSADEKSAIYTNKKACLMLAHCPITLEPSDYTITFDWVGNTNSASGEGLYVAIIPESDSSVKLNSGASTLYDWAKPGSTYSIVNTALGSATSWKQFTGEYHAPTDQKSNKYKLVLIWFQSGTGNAEPPSICVDNINIIDNNYKCNAPTDIETKITATGLQLTWKGKADWYDIKLYDQEKDKWKNVNGIVLRQYTLEGISEGVQNIYIRAHCGDMTSEYIFVQPFYFEKGRRCIDYMALDDQKYTKCFKGVHTEPHNYIQQKLTYGDILHGSEYREDDVFSLHYLNDERDPYTENRLLTKPRDAAASVRLGRYNNSFSAYTESKYVVPEGDKAILMLRYALVLQNPHPPEEMANPTFTLQILADGKKLEYRCGEAEFMAGNTDFDESWHEALGGAVYWKDWTDVAINLREYVGQTITVRLTVTGCAYGAHGGYAYYTLECENGALTGMNCGDIPTTHFTAPSGFNYHWYLAEEPDKVLPNNDKQVFEVDPMDTLLYNVDIISKTNEHCYYTLDATAVPRIPVPEATFARNEENVCENIVSFHQTSHIKYKNQITEREWHTDLPVDYLVWDFGDGSDPLETMAENVAHNFPREGGKYKVTLSASISGNLCVVPLEMNVELPDVSVKAVTIHADVCEGDAYEYNNVYYFNTYVDTLYYTSGKGCDSVVYMDIQFHPKHFEISDSICEGTIYHLGDQQLTASGDYRYKGTSIYGCDSIVDLHLKVIPILKVQFDDTLYICSDGNRILDIPYEVLQGTLEGITVRFDSVAQAAGLDSAYYFVAGEYVEIRIPSSVEPCRLNAVIDYGSPTCDVPNKSIIVEVRYGASYLYQQEGLLSVKNEEYNGGLRFSSYQWYHNGNPLIGHDEPYLAVQNGKEGDEYYVVLTGEDGQAIATCPIKYDLMAIGDIYGDAIYPCTAYTLLGEKVAQLKTKEELRTLPHGVYILTNGHETGKIVR